jgi:hypothetical protein
VAGGDGTTGTIRLSPRVRSGPLDTNPIAGVPLHLIAPFLSEAVVFDSNELESAPRIVAAQEGRVMMGRGDSAYVRGDLAGRRDFRVFRSAKPLVDPTTKEVLGFEAPFLGTAEFMRAGGTSESTGHVVPDTFTLTSVKEEVGVGDRLAPTPPAEYGSYAPHAPAQPVSGQVVAIYGDGLNAGQNQIVSINRGSRDGMERGHVLAIWRDGSQVVDRTDKSLPTLKLPDERHGTLFVFRVFERVSYGLILAAQEPVRSGDRFTQP